MKITSLISILLLTATTVSAQKWGVGLNAGALWNSRLEQSSLYKTPGISTAASADLYYNLNTKWQAGLSLDYQRISSNFDGDLVLENSFNPVTGYEETQHVRFQAYHPVYSLVAHFGRVFTVKRFQYIVGLSAGYYSLHYESRSISDYQSKGEIYIMDGFRSGIQANVNYALAKHWALNGSWAGDYFICSDAHVSVQSFCVTSFKAGIIYRF